MQLQGTNFQSLTEFNLDISGLTVIVGPSNKGKSAVFRALRGLFRNELPAEYVRTTAKELELIATVGGKVIVARRSTKGSTEYIIDGERFKKLNQAIPPELKAFGMNEVEIGEYTIDPIFARQNGKQFLIDPEGYKPMELNTILGAFASTEKLEAGKKVANLEVQHKNSEAKTLAEEVNAAETRKAKLTALAQDTEFMQEWLQRLESEIMGLELKTQWLNEAKARQTHLWPIQSVLSRLTVPDTAEIERLSTAYQYAVQATNSFRVVRFRKRVQESVDAVAAGWQETVRFANAMQMLQDLAEARAEHAERPIEPLTAIITEASQGFAVTKALADSIMLLTQFQSMVERVAALKSAIKKVDDDVWTVNATIKEIQGEMQESQKIACPKCGHKFDPSHTCEVTNAGPA